MKLISEVEIRGFRSIQLAKLDEIGDFTCFAGLNNSGKSNILRSLNAFFNGQTEEGQFLDVDKDYFRPDLRKKKAKQISISVTFSLPAHFKFRKGLESVEELLGNKQFKIKKVWSRKESVPAYYLNGKKLDLQERGTIDQYLEMINFRYIPNRVLPIEVVRKEHQALRDVLIRRLGRRAKGDKETFEAIQQTSEKMIYTLVKRIKEASPEIGQVRLATPTSWRDMVFAFGYRLGSGDIELDDSVQGSGIQSHLMLETLYLIDRDYFQKFGWRQAAIWAVEEPESSLHASLEARVASYLSSISLDPSSRLQVFCTTHSDLMLQYASKTVLVEKKDWNTLCSPMSGPRPAMERLSRMGVSRWAHPILHFPLDPVILVEGKYDHGFIEEALKHIRPKRPVRVCYLEQLDQAGKTGGKDDLLSYVKSQAQAIKGRQKDSPTIVVLDWDASKKRAEFSKPFREDDPFQALVWPQTAFNPKLSSSFRGIERHFSERMIRQAKRKLPDVFFKSSKGRWTVNSDDYGKVKAALYEIVKSGVKENDLVHTKDFIREILKAAGA